MKKAKTHFAELIPNAFTLTVTFFLTLTRTHTNTLTYTDEKKQYDGMLPVYCLAIESAFVYLCFWSTLSQLSNKLPYLEQHLKSAH